MGIMKEKEIFINNINGLPSAAERIVKEFPEQRLFFFYGNLGAGKTTLIQHLCKLLGVQEPVTSPTFALVQEYHTKTDTLYHIDLYRVNKKEDLFEIGIGEYLDSGNYCFIEWPQLVEALADSYVKVEITVMENEKRRVKLQGI
jgi:tRNA threonylcarbamoyladenosine biosynthesis protein TsaE